MDDNKYNLGTDQIEEIVAKGVDYGVVDSLLIANEIIDFCIDAWAEGIDKDDDDPTISMAGEQITELLKIAGVVPDA